MGSIAARRPLLASFQCGSPSSRRFISTRHPPQQEQATTITARPQQPQTPSAITPQHMHPSAVSHPGLSSRPQQRGSDKGIFLTFFGLLAAGGPLSYWYWQYRKEHMRKKKEGILRNLQEKYQARG